MSQTWNDAAARYAHDKLQKLREIPTTISAPPTPKPDKSLEIAQAAIDLHTFMRSEEGDRAINLLNWSNHCIIFAQYDGGVYGTVYYLDVEGLHYCVQAMGAWVASSSHVARPRIQTITPHEVVEAAVQYGDKKPSEIMAWLRAELDKIAATAPQPT